MFLFEIKQRTPRVLLMLKTLFLLLWSKKLQGMAFFIQSDPNRVCAQNFLLHRISSVKWAKTWSYKDLRLIHL